MTNFEKYKDEINSILIDTDCNVPAILNGVPVECDSVMSCVDCELNDDSKGVGEVCWLNFIEWAGKAACLPDASKPKTEEPDGCDGCVHEDKGIDEYPCTKCRNNYTSKWEPRPKKTRQDKFLEMFSNVETADSIVNICPKRIDRKFDRCTYSCIKCHKDYWLQEVEE